MRLDVYQEVRVAARVVARDGTTLTDRVVRWRAPSFDGVVVDSITGAIVGTRPGTGTVTAALVDGTLSRAVAVSVRPSRARSLRVATPFPMLRSGDTLRLASVVADSSGQPLAGYGTVYALATPTDSATLRVTADGVLRAPATTARPRHRAATRVSPRAAGRSSPSHRPAMGIARSTSCGPTAPACGV